MTFFTQAIAPASTAFFLLTVIYEWGYYRAVGPQFQSSVSATDYLTNAILWLPYGALTLIPFIDFHALRNYTGPPRIAGPIRNRTLVALLIFTLFMIGDMLFHGSATNILFLATAFMMLWVLLFYLFFPTSTIASSALLYRISRGLPPFVFGALALGWQNGYSDLTTLSDVYVLKTKQQDEERMVIVLRSLEKGILFKDASSNRVELHRWDDVVSVSRLATVPSDRTYVCYWFGWNCPAPPIP